MPAPLRAQALLLPFLCLAPAASYAADDHAATQVVVDELSRDAAHQDVLAEPLAAARLALERAVRLRAVADEAHARAADGVALEWAEMARDLVRTVDAEKKAAEVRRKALDESQTFERTRALVDEDIARIGRLKAELDDAARSARSARDRRAVEVHAGEHKGDDPTAKKATTAAKPDTAGVAP
jgi:hypothetical protein